jgi:hypothetical protein
VHSRAQSGTRLDGRYRLDELLADGESVTRWRATDEVLGRPVAVHILTAATDADREALLAAAARAGRVPDARWARVLDVGTAASAAVGALSAPDHATPDPPDAVWVISEWVDGPTLTSTVRDEPLPGPAATGLVLDCARAILAARDRGAAHSALTPDDVYLPSGGPRLTGLEVTPDAAPATAEIDTRSLGALLYAALTGRWPLPGWNGLPSPSRGDGTHPRRQRRSVSRELDAVTSRAIAGGYPDTSAFVHDLESLPATVLHPVPPDPDHHRREFAQRLAWRTVPPLLVAAIGLGAWVLGSDLGRVPSPARAVAPSFPQPRQSIGTVAAQVVWSTPPHITSFDPEGDGSEDPGGVGLAVDDDPSTQWSTDTYRGNPVFGGLKHGVGLLLDLRRATTVDAAQLLLSAPGASFEIRAGSVVPRQAADLPLVTSRTNSEAAVRITFAKPVRARYWLLWITSLPKAGDGYRLGVSEIALLG